MFHAPTLRCALLGLALVPAAGAFFRATAQEPQGRVTGRVVNATTQQPIQGAVVQLEGTALSTMSDATGSFDLPVVPPGIYSLSTRAVGFAPYVMADVVVGSGKPLTVRVELAPQAIRLEALEVLPSYFQPPIQAAVSTQELGAEDVRRAPGVQEDVVRAVALLPGVAVTAAGRNDLIVRGGAPYENLFVVDGIEVPNINHFGSQGSTGGPLSLINIDLVQDVAFSSGGLAAKWGDRTASFTNITLREGADVPSGELNLSATGFGAIFEGPLGGNGSFLLSARRSYLDLLFKAAGFSFVPAYWDFQLKTTNRIDDANRISFLAIGALNSVDFVNETADDRYDNSRIVSPEQNQYFTGLTWEHLLERGLLTVTLGRTYTRFRSVQRDSLVPPNDVLRGYSTEGENSLRADLVLDPTPRLELDVGGVTKFASTLDYDVFLDGSLRLDQNGVPRPLRADTSFTAFRTATYAEARYWVTSAARVSVGLRGNYYGFLADAFRLAPRVGLRLEPAAATAVTLSYARTYQAPSYIWLVGDPANADSLGPFHADQAVVGIEHSLREDLKLQVETYYKVYGDYPARIFRPEAVLAPSGFEDATTDIPFGLEPLDNAGTGRAYGVELFLQKRLSSVPVYGLASIAVSRSEFKAIDGITRAGAYDGRVIANVLAGWRINTGWEVSGKFRLATGLPTTPFIESGPEAGRLDFTRYNAGPRLPTFHALDVRVDRRWSFRGWQLDVYVDVQNVYGRKNVSQYTWNPRTGEVEPNDSLGILPSIGVNVEF
jgi:hypothetical protein